MAVNVDRVKHLELIQAIVTRMAGNSFLIKGWTVETDPGNLPGLLRHSGERRGEEAASDHRKERPPVHYSIT